MYTVNLPDPGEGLLEAEITRWLVEVGQTVAVNDPIVEIETAKSLVELPAPYAGVVARLLAGEGDLVAVGAPIMLIGAEGESDAAASAPAPSAPASDPSPADAAPDAHAAALASAGIPVPEPQAAEETQALLVGYGAAATSPTRRARKADPPQPAPEHTTHIQRSFTTAAPVGRRTDRVSPLHPSEHEESDWSLPHPGEVRGTEPSDEGRPLATPVVRRLARDLGVDLSSVVGTGKDGQVLPADVAGAVGGGAGETRRQGQPRRIPLRGVRRAMVQSMAASVETPQASIWLDVDVSETVALIGQLKARREFADLRISPILILAKAVTLAIARHPEINATLMLDRDEIVVHPDVNLGIAAATQRGLVVPNIKRSQELTLLELAQALNELVAKAREGRITPADCTGGTFSITNVGVFGVEGGTPILNPGESAILCLGAFNRRPWVVGTGDDERIEPRWVATLALTIDHRVLDGEQGSRFLADVATILADPGLALLF